MFAHQIKIARRQRSELFQNNPFSGHEIVNEQPRKTCISPSELPDWFDAVRKLQSHTTRDYLILLLFTGLRRREASNLTWADIDLRKKTLTATGTKNGKDHTIPLSNYLHELLTQRKLDSVSQWVFPGTGTDGPLSEPKKAILKIADRAGILCSPHGLRRTFSNVALNDARVPEPVRKILMNHAPNRNDVTSYHYTTLDIDQLRPHMQAVTDALLSLIKQPKPIADVRILEVV